MDLMNFIYLLITIISAVASAVASIVAIRKAAKARKAAEEDAANAKTDADREAADKAKEKADSDLLATAKGFISAAEVAFDAFDKTLKAQGSSAGAMKKDTVFNKL